MSLYNIVNQANLVAGQPEDVGTVLANFQAIQGVLNGGIDDANVRSTAAIQGSKLNIPANINQILRGDGTWGVEPIAGLAGYPADATKFLRGDGSWNLPGVIAIYRKTTTKQVINTVTETDLLNGEITVGANALGVSGGLRLTASGDWVQNSGAYRDIPRMKLKLGATVLLDSGVTATTPVVNSATRQPWRFVAEIVNLGAANSQWVALSGHLEMGGGVNGGVGTFATGEGSVTICTYDITSKFYNGFNYNAGGSGAVDTTIAQALALTVTLPTATATIDMTLKNALVEIL